MANSCKLDGLRLSLEKDHVGEGRPNRRVDTPLQASTGWQARLLGHPPLRCVAHIWRLGRPRGTQGEVSTVVLGVLGSTVMPCAADSVEVSDTAAAGLNAAD